MWAECCTHLHCELKRPIFQRVYTVCVCVTERENTVFRSTIWTCGGSRRGGTPIVLGLSGGIRGSVTSPYVLPHWLPHGVQSWAIVSASLLYTLFKQRTTSTECLMLSNTFLKQPKTLQFILCLNWNVLLVYNFKYLRTKDTKKEREVVSQWERSCFFFLIPLTIWDRKDYDCEDFLRRKNACLEIL